MIILNDENEIVEIREMREEEESTQFYNGILVPGFVNSHCHIELSHLKGLFSEGSGMAGFIDQINRLRDGATKEEKRSALKREMEQLYSAGVSAMADISNGDESFEAKADSPLYSRTFLELFGSEPKEAQEILKGGRELQKLAERYGLDATITPHSCYTMSPQLLEGAVREGAKGGWISYHNQESWEEEELLLRGEGPLARSYKERSLSTPPVTGESALLYFLERIKGVEELERAKLLLVHNTFTNERSVERAMESIKELYWGVCPLSNLFIHKTLPPLELLMRKGATIALGTDSLSSNHLLSMVEEIKTVQNYFPSIELGTILEWSSFNGAKFLGKEESLGSFEIGKRPGVVLIDEIDWQTMRLTKNSKSIRLV